MRFHLDCLDLCIHSPITVFTYDIVAHTSIQVGTIQAFMLSPHFFNDVFKPLNEFTTSRGSIMHVWIEHIALYKYKFKRAIHFITNKEDIKAELITNYTQLLKEKEKEYGIIVSTIQTELEMNDQTSFNKGDVIYYTTTIQSSEVPPLTFLMEIHLK